MGSAPFIIGSVQASNIFPGPHPDAAISNDGGTTVYIDDSPTVSQYANDWVLRPGDRCLWLKDKPLWAIAAQNPNTGDGVLNVSTNVANFASTSLFNPNAGAAVITGGTVTTFVGDGINGVLGTTYVVHSFTTSGVLTCTAETTVRFLMIGGGSAGNGGNYLGGAGDLHVGSLVIPAGSYTVTVGPGGVTTGGANDRYGDLSEIVGLMSTAIAPVFDAGAFSQLVGAGGTIAAPTQGYTSLIRGTSEVYGQPNLALPTANRGDGCNTGPGSDGIVIVQYAA